jgi:hypothetical protein
VVSAGSRPLTPARRRAFALFVLVAALLWWRARSSGFFFIVGLEGSASANLGPLLPALCGGFSAAMAMLIADSAAGTVAGLIAGVALVALPGFLPLHRDSLTGPPLLAITLLMLATMTSAPRFSIAYGTLGAIGGFFVATEGIGLPLSAAAWALVHGPRENGRTLRFILALIPAVLVLLLAHVLGGAWPHGLVYEWRGGLDRGLRAAGMILGNQMAPLVDYPALRFLVIADLALIILGIVGVAWLRYGRTAPEMSIMRAIYPVAGLLTAGLVIGLGGQTLLVRGTWEPDLAAVMPIVALCTVVLVVSIAALWPRWPAWARIGCVVMVLGWLQASLRS